MFIEPAFINMSDLEKMKKDFTCYLILKRRMFAYM